MTLTLGHQSFQIQEAAMQALLEIADPVAIGELGNRLADGRVGSTAEGVIRQFGSLAEPEMIRLLKSRDPNVRSRAINILSAIGGERAYAALRPLARDQSVRSAVERAAREIAEREGAAVQPRYLPTSTVDQIIAALQSKRNSDIERALRRVEEIAAKEERRKEVVAALEALYPSSARNLPEMAVAAVGKWGTDESVPALLKLVDDKDSSLREAAYEALAELGDKRAIAPLVAKLETSDYRTVRNLLPAFGSDAEPELLRLFDTTTSSTARGSIFTVLARVGGEDSLRVLNPLAAQAGADGYKARLAVENIEARADE